MFITSFSFHQLASYFLAAQSWMANFISTGSLSRACMINCIITWYCLTSYRLHATGRHDVNTISFALIAWNQIAEQEDASHWLSKENGISTLIYTGEHNLLTSFSQFIRSVIHTSNTSLVRLPQTMPSQSPYWDPKWFQSFKGIRAVHITEAMQKNCMEEAEEF